MTKMTTGDAHNLFIAVQRMSGDAGLKLKDEVALALVINENKLLPIAQAYEKIRQQRYAAERKAGTNDAGVFIKDAQLFDAEFSLIDLDLRAVEVDVGVLKMIKMDDLKPTKGEHFIPRKIALKPMIEDFPTE